jgi:pimeloyl-ACP methyl ester carboxylesterase
VSDKQPEHARLPAKRHLLPEIALAVPLIFNVLKPAARCNGDGQGRPVLVIPGIMSGDESTVHLRRSLRGAGFHSYGWKQGVNLGLKSHTLDRLEARVDEITGLEGRKPILLGWSLGGVFARAFANRVPDKAAMVVTLASPFSGSPRANRAWRLYNLLNDHTVDSPPPSVDYRTKPPVPTIAVWSARDGIIQAACTRGEPGESDIQIELDLPHFGYGGSRKGVRQVVELLARNLPD